MPNLRLLLWAKKRGNASVGFEFGQRAPAWATCITRAGVRASPWRMRRDGNADAAMVTMQSMTMAITHAAAPRWFRAAPTGPGTCGGDTGARVNSAGFVSCAGIGDFGPQLRA